MKYLSLFLLAVVHAFSLMAENAQAEFDKGLSAANKKAYAEAITHFESVVSSEPTNASAYYNMGNCYFETKQYGMAIWAFEKSLQYDPGNANTLKNLEVCHFQLELPTYAPVHSGFARSIYGFGSRNWSYLAVASFVLMAALIVFSRLTKRIQWKRLLVIVAFFVFITGLLLIVAANRSSTAEGLQNIGIVIHPNTPTFLNAKKEVSPVKLKEGTRIQDLQLVKGSLLSGVLENGQQVLIQPEDIRKF